jgi:hypothetical protein
MQTMFSNRIIKLIPGVDGATADSFALEPVNARPGLTTGKRLARKPL